MKISKKEKKNLSTIKEAFTPGDFNLPLPPPFLSSPVRNPCFPSFSYRPLHLPGPIRHYLPWKVFPGSPLTHSRIRCPFLPPPGPLAVSHEMCAFLCSTRKELWSENSGQDQGFKRNEVGWKVKHRVSHIARLLLSQETL